MHVMKGEGRVKGSRALFTDVAVMRRKGVHVFDPIP